MVHVTIWSNGLYFHMIMIVSLNTRCSKLSSVPSANNRSCKEASDGPCNVVPQNPWDQCLHKLWPLTWPLPPKAFLQSRSLRKHWGDQVEIENIAIWPGYLKISQGRVSVLPVKVLLPNEACRVQPRETWKSRAYWNWYRQAKREWWVNFNVNLYKYPKQV